MDGVMNRIEEELSKWYAQEKRFSKLFSFDISVNRLVLKEKLSYYDRVAAKYKGTRNLDERLALRMLRYERNRLEKLLYPNLLVRLSRRLLVVPVYERIMIRQDGRKIEQNSRRLHHSVRLAGFPDLSEKIRENMKRGERQFAIPVSHFINEKDRIDYQLSFSKARTGDYLFDGYKIALNKEGNPGESRQQYFSMNHGYKIDSTEAFNLLSNRCVYKADTWLQLDFNDKDAHGNFRLKQFRTGYGFDLEKALQSLPLTKGLDKDNTDRLMKSLQKGNRVLVNFVKGSLAQQCSIEANPQLKSFNIYDDQSRKITLQKALGRRSKEVMQVADKITGHSQNTISKKADMRVRS